MFKNFVQKKLEKRVREYFAKHPDVKLVTVTGSVGKTSSKTAIATVLSQQYRVRMRNDNHNTHISAPVAILGIDFPENPRSFLQWWAVLRAAKKRVKNPTDVDVIVQELGSDRVGEIAHFGTYLRPHIGVVTGVTPEHMEFFGTIETVAQEELTAANFSETALINRDDIDGRFANFLTNENINTYGVSGSAEYRFEEDDFTLEKGHTGKVIAPELNEPLEVSAHVLGEHSMRPVMAAVAVACKMGVLPANIAKGVSEIRAATGRMNVLEGVENTVLIDDTYNSSPAAASAALQTLYTLAAPQRIAILGSMNELGSTSADAHRELGEMCDPSLLAWVVTIGDEAEKYLAPAARARGCQVKSFKSAIQAGAFVHQMLEPQAIVLAKGSQGDIYAEEALKILLHTNRYDHLLVRQTPEWLAIKQTFFGSL
jgi:UDP-N-acetylmuramoyl-tripeptide--D-alanyl-D-alanine ligase